MNRLIHRGLVTRGKGSHGLYFPTTKARRGISLTADVLTNSFVSSILDNDNFVMDVPSWNKENNNTELGHALLSLSNILGGFIVYTLIQSMNPENKITQTSRNVIEKDFAVQAWLEDALSILLENILSHFKERVFLYLEGIDDDIRQNASESEIFDKAGTEYVKFFDKRPFFTLDQRIISELINCFSQLFPNLSHDLEKIRSEVPKLLAQEINHMRYIEERVKVQKTCKHKYQQLLNQLYDSDKFEHCRKCHKTRRKEN